MAARKTARCRPWTPHEERYLTREWGERGVATIARKLRRTPVAVYSRARTLGLPCGVVQGHESFTAACRRTGFMRAQLRRILTSAHLPPRPVMGRPRANAKGRFLCTMVSPDDVDAAIAHWNATEVVALAAAARGVAGSTLRRWLKVAGHVPPRRGTTWRVATVTIDRVVKAQRGREQTKAAA